MISVSREDAVSMFGSDYEIDFGANLPHFTYSDFTDARMLDGVATRWHDRPQESKEVRIYERLGRRNRSTIGDWNRFFSDVFSKSGSISSQDLTRIVADQSASAFEKAMIAATGIPYREPGFLEKFFGQSQKPVFNRDHRIFSDLCVKIIPLPETVSLTEHHLAPGDKIYHLLDRNILSGTKIVEYVISDRYASPESRHSYTVKYTAHCNGSQMPLHFELRKDYGIYMSSYGDCSSPLNIGSLHTTLASAKQAESEVWEKVRTQLDLYQSRV